MRPATLVGLTLFLSCSAANTPVDGGSAGGSAGGAATGGNAATGGGTAGGSGTGGSVATGGGAAGGSATGGGAATGGGSTTVGTEYFVATTGADTNAGTQTAPFRTLQKAITVASAAASTVTVRGGTYTEKVTISTGTTPLLVRSAPSETAILDGTGLTVSNGQQGLINIDSRSEVTIERLELRNYRSTTSAVPLGIYAFGSGTNLTLRGNHIHDIVTTVGSCNGNGGNAFGLAVYGSVGATAWTNVKVLDNELDHLTLGCSESLSINGNVDGFEVSGNRVHDNDNIGIVAIGFEGTSPSTATDQARNGVIRGNTVYNITSVNNPAYGGEAAADGIYVDGGKQILIERNLVHHADLGIEVASEHASRSSAYVLVRSNVIYASTQAGISLGGYANNVGNADHDVVLNNTLYDDTVEVQLQFHVTETVLINNVLFSPTADYTAGPLTGVTQTTNLKRTGAAAGTFVSAPADLHTVAALDAQVIDVGTAFTCPAGWACPAVWGVPLEGALDAAGNARVKGAAIDLGAYER